MPHSNCLSHDQYVDYRNVQDGLISKEFQTIRLSVDEVKMELSGVKTDLREFKNDIHEFKNEIHERFKDIDVRFQDIDVRFDEQKAEILRLTDYMRNSTLRNPTLPIRPLISYRSQGIVHPRTRLFPKHANEFYALRNPVTTRQRDMLAYLVDFYDVPGLASRHDPQSDTDNTDDEDIVIDDPAYAVDLIESILGLNEDNFKQFRQRAQHWADHPKPLRVKRSQVSAPDPPRNPLRPRLELRPLVEDTPGPVKKISEEPEDDPPLLWGTRSTPSSQRPTVNQLRLRARQQELANPPSDSGTTTNTNTTRSEPHE